MKSKGPNHEYVMDYIPDKDVYQAVMYCCWILKNTPKRYNDAVRMAAYKYDVPMSEVRHYMSQRSGRSQAGKSRTKKEA